MNEWARVFTEQIAAIAGEVDIVHCIGIEDSISNESAYYTQRFELDANGTTRIKKFGYCAERTTNNVHSITGGSR